MKKLLLSLFSLLAIIGTASADDALYTCLFGANYNSKEVSSYSDTFTATNGGYSWTVTNYNNNKNGWDYVKCGRKNYESTGIITTDFAAPEKIDKVVMTIDKVTAASVNSIKLYSSADKESWEEVSSAASVAQGDLPLEIASPRAGLYYKLEVDCASASSNGVLQLSKLQYFGTASEKEIPALSFSETSVSVMQGGAFEAPELNNPEGLTIAWSSSDETVATVDNNGNVTILGAGTTVITATSEETATFAPKSTSYTLNVIPAANSIAEFMELGKDNSKLQIVVNFDMTVGFCNYGNIYATDGTDWIQIYKSGNQTSYQLNDVIEKGWTGTYTFYSNTTPEMIPVGDLTMAATKGNLTLAEYTLDQLTTEMVNQVVVVKNVEFTEATPDTKTSWTADDFTFYNKFTIESVEAGKYNVTGVVEIFKNAPQLSVISYEALAVEKKNVTLAFPQATVELDENEDGEYFLDLAVMTPAVQGATITYSATEQNSGESATCFYDQTENKVYLSAEPGTYVITASFAGNEEYNAATATCTVTINGTPVVVKKDVTLAFPQATLELDENEDGEYFLDLAVMTPAVQGATITYSAAEQNSGEGATCFFDQTENKVYLSAEPGTYVITASFAGNEEYNPATATCTVTINGTPVVVKKNASLEFPQTAYAFEANEEGEYFIDCAELTPAIENAVVTYSAIADGSETSATCYYDQTEDKVYLAAGVGKYIVTATFEGNDEFNAATGTCEVVISETPIVKQDVTLTFEEETFSFDENNEMTYTVKGVTATPESESINVKYTCRQVLADNDIDFLFFDKDTNEVSLVLSPGTYVLKATFEGNELYNATEAEATVLVVPTQPEVPVATVKVNEAPVETAETIELPNKASFADITLTTTLPATTIHYNITKEGEENDQTYSVYNSSKGISVNYACTVTYFATRYEQQSERASITFTMASSGVAAILAADPEAKVYNLKGERIYGEPADGLYIVVSNGKATKTMIKK